MPALLPKRLQRLKELNPDVIDEIWYDDDADERYILLLLPGYQNTYSGKARRGDDLGDHLIVEDRVEDVIQMFAGFVEPCECDWCMRN